MSGEKTACAGRCGTCKHWTRFSPDDFDSEYYGPYAGLCKSDKFVYAGETTITLHDGLLYWDGEDYSAGFNTGENFGCVHWVAK